jgi:hypothetical protein
MVRLDGLSSYRNPWTLEAYLLNPDVPLDVNLLAPVLARHGNRLDGIQRKPAHKVSPLADKLGPDGATNKLNHGLAVVRVDLERNLVDNLESVCERLFVRSDDGDWVNVAVERGQGRGEDFAG